jgi:hypothetical protein
MGDVVHLQRHDGPHAAGEAVCLACQNKWQAGAPFPVTTFLECPKCSAMKGVYVNYFAPPAETVWTCNCEAQLFFVTNNGVFCPNCGVKQKGW